MSQAQAAGAAGQPCSIGHQASAAMPTTHCHQASANELMERAHFAIRVTPA